jgi:hypothetical protein
MFNISPILGFFNIGQSELSILCILLIACWGLNVTIQLFAIIDLLKKQNELIKFQLNNSPNKK